MPAKIYCDLGWPCVHFARAHRHKNRRLVGKQSRFPGRVRTIGYDLGRNIFDLWDVQTGTIAPEDWLDSALKMYFG